MYLNNNLSGKFYFSHSQFSTHSTQKPSHFISPYKFSLSYSHIFRQVQDKQTIINHSKIKQRKQKYSKSSTIEKVSDKKKDYFNKTFNRTKIDSEHNFIGRKYQRQIKRERQNKQESFTSNKFRKSMPLSLKKQWIKIDFDEEKRKTLIKQKKQSSKKLIKADHKLPCQKYHRFLIKKRISQKKTEQNIDNGEDLKNSQISPWDIKNNGSWIPSY